MISVVVTGGCGFIGSALVRYLMAQGFAVHNIDKRSAAANNSLDKIDDPRYTFYNLDLTVAKDAIKKILVNVNPEFIYHLAAETHVDNSIAQPLVSVTNNVLATVNLFEAVCDSGIVASKKLRKLVLVSTDEVYGDSVDVDEQHAFEENHPLVPSSPYSASKAASDQLALAWHRTFGLPVVISRCSNNYGPWQFPEKLIPKCLARALAGQPIPVYGDGLQMRDWLYVDDHVAALHLLAERGRSGEIYNVGSDSLCTNRELVNQLCTLLDTLQPVATPYAELITHVADRPGHDRCYRVNWQKLRTLGWQPRRTFAQGLTATVQWYLAHPHFLMAELAQ